MKKFPKVTMNKTLSALLLLGVAFSFITIVNAVSQVPNPGHDISTIGGYNATGDLLYGTSGTNGGLSALSDVATGNALLSGGVGAPPTWGQVNLASMITGTLPVANGGTGQTSTTTAFNALSPLTTKGDLLASDGTNDVRLAVGTNGQVLTASSTATAGVTWATSAGGGTPAGANTNIQFNNAGAFGATNAFTWDNATNDLYLIGPDTGITLTGITNEPAAPAAGNLHLYSKKIAGRMLPKMLGPSGVDTALQPALFSNNMVLFAPSSGTVGTGTGFGTVWTPGGTVTHPTPASTAPAITSQMHRTRYANVVTTTNQTLGVISTAAGLPQFWIGNAAGLGGFFFHTRFIIGLWPANTVRLFAGLTSLATAMTTADTQTAHYVGLWHDTTDGANVLSLVTMNGTTRTKTAIAGATLAAGQGFDFTLFAKPNDTVINYRLVSINTGATLVDTSIATTLPANTTFMGPQVIMSNGTANTTANTTALDINRIYIESDN